MPERRCSACLKQKEHTEVMPNGRILCFQCAWALQLAPCGACLRLDYQATFDESNLCVECQERQLTNYALQYYDSVLRRKQRIEDPSDIVEGAAAEYFKAVQE